MGRFTVTFSCTVRLAGLKMRDDAPKKGKAL